MVVAVVGGVVGHLQLDAGPRGAGVAAAERHAVHQVLAVHVAANAAKRMRRRVIVFMSRYDGMEVRVRWAVKGQGTTQGSRVNIGVAKNNCGSCFFSQTSFKTKKWALLTAHKSSPVLIPPTSTS